MAWSGRRVGRQDCACDVPETSINNKKLSKNFIKDFLKMLSAEIVKGIEGRVKFFGDRD